MTYRCLASLAWVGVLALGCPSAACAGETALVANLHTAIHDGGEAGGAALSQVTAARGEFEPVALKLKATRAVKGLSLTCGPLRGPGGAEITAARFLIQQEANFKAHVGPKDKRHDVVLPYWLVPPELGASELAADGTMTFWITVQVPDDAAPGEYKGTLSVKAEGEPELGLPWSLQVLPITLERPSVAFAMFYTYEFRYLERYDPAYEPAAKRRDAKERPGFVARGEAVVRDLAEHGMTAIIPHSSRVLLRKNGKLELPDLEASLHAARANGMTDTPACFVGNHVNAQWDDLPKFDEARDGALLKEIATRAGEVAKAAGYDGLVLIPADEPTIDRKYAVAEKLLRAAQGVPNIRFGVTGNHETFTKFGALHQVSVYDGGTPEHWAEGRKAGRTIWLYDNHATTGFNPVWSRFIYGFLGWRAGFDGIGSWTYPLNIGAWNDRKREDAEGHKIPDYDAGGRPINPIVWEAIREGADDRRYLDTLKKGIADARHGGRTVAADTAQVVLDELWKALSPNLADYGFLQTEQGAPTPGALNAAWMDTARLRLTKALLELRGAEKP